jgi:hypothetical protein
MRPPSLLKRCPACTPTWRGLSTSALRAARQQDHYAVLKLPRNATKAQIKARFYEVSRYLSPSYILSRKPAQSSASASTSPH